MVTVMIPISRLIYNFILRLRRRKTESESGKQNCQPAVDRVLKSMLSKLQNKVKTLIVRILTESAPDIRLSGRHFITSFTGQDETFANTASISYFACFSCKLEYAMVTERTCNDINSMDLPVKCTISTQEADDDSIIMNLHISGTRLIDDKQGLELLKSLLSCFFFVQRTISERFDAIKADEPGDIFLNRQPYIKSAYAIANAELNLQPDGWNRPWFETPEWTVEEFIDCITGYKPELDYSLCVNGNLIDDGLKSKFCPLTGLNYTLFTDDGELQNTRMSIQLFRDTSTSTCRP